MATKAQIQAAVIKRTSKFKDDKEYVHASFRFFQFQFDLVYFATKKLTGQIRMLQTVSQAAAAAAAGH
jgi:hypothetical protein